MTLDAAQMYFEHGNRFCELQWKFRKFFKDTSSKEDS